MPREWTRDERERERDDRRDLRRPRDDFGQADYSSDYAYDPDRRAGYRQADEVRGRGEDYGLADYSNDYAYDPERGHGYRRYSEDDRDYADPDDRDRSYRRDAYRRDEPDHEIGERRRSWTDRAGAFFGGRATGEEPRRRRGPSDRVLWAVIVERLEDQRGLDLRDVEVLVEDAEVTLNGRVRRKEDKRRIEDIADIDGVRHVQNNLRVREPGRRWFG
jgi:hypothetical protein